MTNRRKIIVTVQLKSDKRAQFTSCHAAGNTETEGQLPAAEAWLAL